MPHAQHTYDVSIPVQIRGRTLREVVDVPMNLVYESLEAEVVKGGVMELCDPSADLANVCCTPAYLEHPLVVEAVAQGRPYPIPLGMYLDGVKYTSVTSTRPDSVLGIWAINLLTDKRHIISATRAGDSCQCGCQGWCTLAPILSAVSWMFEAMARGSRPARTHDDKEWNGDATALSFSGVLLWVKGDWQEHSKSLGLMPWNTIFSPCPMCDTTQDTLHTLYDDVSVAHLPWREHSHEAYRSHRIADSFKTCTNTCKH